MDLVIPGMGGATQLESRARLCHARCPRGNRKAVAQLASGARPQPQRREPSIPVLNFSFLFSSAVRRCLATRRAFGTPHRTHRGRCLSLSSSPKTGVGETGDAAASPTARHARVKMVQDSPEFSEESARYGHHVLAANWTICHGRPLAIRRPLTGRPCGFLTFDCTCGGRRRLLACSCPQFRPTIVTASTQLLWELKVHVCASCCARLDRA